MSTKRNRFDHRMEVISRLQEREMRDELEDIFYSGSQRSLQDVHVVAMRRIVPPTLRKLTRSTGF